MPLGGHGPRSGISTELLQSIIDIFNAPVDGKRISKLFVVNGKLQVEYEIEEENDG